jgi:hypothetical protein
LTDRLGVRAGRTFAFLKRGFGWRPEKPVAETEPVTTCLRNGGIARFVGLPIPTIPANIPARSFG